MVNKHHKYLRNKRHATKNDGKNTKPRLTRTLHHDLLLGYVMSDFYCQPIKTQQLRGQGPNLSQNKQTHVHDLTVSGTHASRDTQRGTLVRL